MKLTKPGKNQEQKKPWKDKDEVEKRGKLIKSVVDEFALTRHGKSLRFQLKPDIDLVRLTANIFGSGYVWTAEGLHDSAQARLSLDKKLERDQKKVLSKSYQREFNAGYGPKYRCYGVGQLVGFAPEYRVNNKAELRWVTAPSLGKILKPLVVSEKVSLHKGAKGKDEVWAFHYLADALLANDEGTQRPPTVFEVADLFVYLCDVIQAEKEIVPPRWLKKSKVAAASSILRKVRRYHADPTSDFNCDVMLRIYGIESTVRRFKQELERETERLSRV